MPAFAMHTSVIMLQHELSPPLSQALVNHNAIHYVNIIIVLGDQLHTELRLRSEAQNLNKNRG